MDFTSIPSLEARARKLLRAIRRRQIEHPTWRDAVEYRRVLVILIRIVSMHRTLFGENSEKFEEATLHAVECHYALARSMLRRGNFKHCAFIVKSALKLIPVSAYTNESGNGQIRNGSFRSILIKLHNIQAMCYTRSGHLAAARLELDACLAFSQKSIIVSAYVAIGTSVILIKQGKLTVALQKGLKAVHELEKIMNSSTPCEDRSRCILATRLSFPTPTCSAALCLPNSSTSPAKWIRRAAISRPPRRGP